VSNAAVEQARALLRAGRPDEAVALLEKVAAGGGTPSVLAMLGHSLYHDGRIADARRTLADAVARFPFDAGVQDANARIRWMDGEGKHFADTFLAAVAERPTDAALRFKCADLLRLAEDHDAAERLLRDGIVRDPGNPSFAATLGVLLDETGRLDEALATNAGLARAFPNVPVLHLNLAHTLMRLGRAQEAISVIGPLRKAMPDLQQAITYEAMALKQLGDPRHDWLCNYQAHVQAYDLDPPEGYSDIASFNAELGAYLRGQMDAGDHPLDQSLRWGRQTSYNLLFADDAIMRGYLAALERPIRSYIASLGDDRAHPLEGRKAAGFALSGCWSVLLRPGGFHVNHTHPEGWISSSYYVSLPASMGGETGQEGWIKFGEPRWPTPGCVVERAIEPREGRLVLFPSYMWHGTAPFTSGERLTAPFDVMPR
jgi:tetratricopeptide (TPR) repeat protein